MLIRERNDVVEEFMKKGGKGGNGEEGEGDGVDSGGEKNTPFQSESELVGTRERAH